MSAEPLSAPPPPDGGHVVVAPAGELDLSNDDRLEDEVRAHRRAGARRVVLDLRAVTFLDSSALRVLLSLRNAARRDGHELVLVPGPRAVQRVFELSRTRALFDWRGR